MLLVIGFFLVLFGFLSRLFALKVYGRWVASENREATGRALFTVQSDRVHVRRIVAVTYSAIIGGMALLTAGALTGV